MNEEAVIDILGCPPGNYQTKPKLFGHTTLSRLREEEWWANTDYVVIYFNEENKVVSTGYRDLREMEITPVRYNMFDCVWDFFQQIGP